jgi:hypothetical protein
MTGAVDVEATPDRLGDDLREMAGEYNRALRYVLGQTVGVRGVLKAVAGRGAPEPSELGYALLHAERLAAMLAYTRAAEALAAHAGASARRRALAERFVGRALPQVRMYGELVRSGDRRTLEALSA